MKIKAKRIYLDVCTLCRPFDEQNYLRIHIETEAVKLILSKLKEGVYKLLVSPVHIKEIEANSDIFERIKIRTILDKLGEFIIANRIQAQKRAEELVELGFGIADAAHIAFAEQNATHFISCDDLLIKKCLQYKINVWCGNPIVFCDMEGLK